MTTEEMRELDQWICGKVFGEMVSFGVIIRLNQLPNGEPEEVPLGPVPNYTTEPAAAMDVLKKCIDIKDIGVSIFAVKNHESTMWIVRHGIYRAEALTIPLAICLFAKQIFEKGKQ